MGLCNRNAHDVKLVSHSHSNGAVPKSVVAGGVVMLQGGS